MAMGRPSDTDLKAWFHLAVQMNQNHVVDEAFQASHKLAYVCHIDFNLFKLKNLDVFPRHPFHQEKYLEPRAS